MAVPPGPSTPDQISLVLDHLWLADAVARRFRGRGEDDETFNRWPAAP